MGSRHVPSQCRLAEGPIPFNAQPKISDGVVLPSLANQLVVVKCGALSVSPFDLINYSDNSQSSFALWS